MAIIRLTRGKVAVIDDDDFTKVNQHKWHCNNHGYAMSWFRTSDGKRSLVSMHRFILSTPKGLLTDHINLDKLDNRKENLRVCTATQNECNKDLSKRNKSGYKGVSFDSRTGKWRVAIKANGKFLRLGRHKNILDAAREYNENAIKFFGEFARLNSLEGGKSYRVS